MTFQNVASYLALGALLVVLLWLLLRPWRRRRAYQRALLNPAVLSAACWWADELSRTTGGISTEGICRFRASLAGLIASASVFNQDALYHDIGPACDGYRFLRAAADEAGIDIRFSFPFTVKMRIREHHVLVSRSGGALWEPIWRNW